MPDIQKLPVKALDERTLQDLGGRLRDLPADGNHRHAVEALGTEPFDLLRQRGGE